MSPPSRSIALTPLALLRDYFAELTVRYFHRETTDEEIDKTLDEFPSTGLALFLLLRTEGGLRVALVCT